MESPDHVNRCFNRKQIINKLINNSVNRKVKKEQSDHKAKKEKEKEKNTRTYYTYHGAPSKERIEGS